MHSAVPPPQTRLDEPGDRCALRTSLRLQGQGQPEGMSAPGLPTVRCCETEVGPGLLSGVWKVLECADSVMNSLAGEG